MNLQTFSFTTDELTNFANESKSILLARLVKDGILSEERAENIDRTTALIVTRKGYLCRLFSETTEPYKTIVVKMDLQS